MCRKGRTVVIKIFQGNSYHTKNMVKTLALQEEGKYIPPNYIILNRLVEMEDVCMNYEGGRVGFVRNDLNTCITYYRPYEKD